MSLIKIGSVIINLDAIEAVYLGAAPQIDGTELNQVRIRLNSGEEVLFTDEQAEKLKAYFDKLSAVQDIMNPPVRRHNVTSSFKTY